MSTPRDIARAYLAVLNAVRKLTDEQFVAGALGAGGEGLQGDREQVLKLYVEAEEMLDAAVERYDAARLEQLRQMAENAAAELEREEAKQLDGASQKWASQSLREERTRRAERLAARRAQLDAEAAALERARNDAVKRSRRAKVTT